MFMSRVCVRTHLKGGDGDTWESREGGKGGEHVSMSLCLSTSLYLGVCAHTPLEGLVGKRFGFGPKSQN
jgi:hypothetical protein